MEEDATNIFEASKYGATFFVTVGAHVFKRNQDIRRICGVNIMQPSEVSVMFKNRENSK
jgi:hypothetical protein